MKRIRFRSVFGQWLILVLCLMGHVHGNHGLANCIPEDSATIRLHEIRLTYFSSDGKNDVVSYRGYLHAINDEEIVLIRPEIVGSTISIEVSEQLLDINRGENSDYFFKKFDWDSLLSFKMEAFQSSEWEGLSKISPEVKEKIIDDFSVYSFESACRSELKLELSKSSKFKMQFHLARIKFNKSKKPRVESFFYRVSEDSIWLLFSNNKRKLKSDIKHLRVVPGTLKPKGFSFSEIHSIRFSKYPNPVGRAAGIGAGLVATPLLIFGIPAIAEDKANHDDQIDKWMRSVYISMAVVGVGIGASLGAIIGAATRKYREYKIEGHSKSHLQMKNKEEINSIYWQRYRQVGGNQKGNK